MKKAIKKGVVLAGGEGKRLRPLTLKTPKPLIAIRERPLINYNLELLAKHGVNDVKIIIRPEHREGYRRWLREHASTFKAVKLEVLEEPEPMGTLGYLFNHLQGWTAGDDVYVTNGDDIKDADLSAMEVFHGRMGLPATVALVEEKKRTDGGFVLVRGDRILDFSEKARGTDSKLISAGLYILSSQAFDAVRRAGLGDEKHLMFETDLFPVLAKEQQLAGFVYEGVLYDCGTVERLEEAVKNVIL